MAIVEVNDSNFDDLTEKYPFVVLDFWASWCGPCRMFAPVFEEASERHPDVLFGKVNTEVEEKLAKEFQIFSIPTLIAAREGTIVYARPGTLSPDKLDALVVDLRAGRLG